MLPNALDGDDSTNQPSGKRHARINLRRRARVFLTPLSRLVVCRQGEGGPPQEAHGTQGQLCPPVLSVRVSYLFVPPFVVKFVIEGVYPGWMLLGRTVCRNTSRGGSRCGLFDVMKW